MTLTLARRHLEDILAHVTRACPHEACGLVAGSGGKSISVHPIRNVLAAPDAFQMDPREQIEAMTRIFDTQQELLALYHSHPAGGPFPSEEDVRQHAYPEAVCLIAAPQADGWRLRAFSVLPAGWAEVLVNIQEA